jgi:nucleotidyltransferase/DNA polymerase involved in DNA repair
MIRSLFRRIFDIHSSAPASYPLDSTPRNKSLSARTKDRYFSLGNSQGNTQSSVSAGWGTRRNSVDRIYPLTRQDSPPNSGIDGGGGETGSQKGIVKGTDFSVSYS